MIFMEWLHSLVGNLRADQVSVTANLVVALAAVIGVPVGLVQLGRLVSLRQDEEQQRRRHAAEELLAAYLNEYRTPQMGRAIANLWDLYKLARRNPRELVRLYIRLYKKERNHAFHFEVRRRVSIFYQHLALFVEREEYAKEEIYRMWSKSNLDLIPKVLIPLEVVAVPEILSGFPSEVRKDNFYFDTSLEHSITAMQQLYDNAPEKQITHEAGA
ncbi:MAG: hypothetical protein ABSG38_17260 [Spirochaetia bacterium]|jgi:hypothetical protein